nr:probable E3 ubiquitin-protein ligase LUL4 [Ipomoea batatas]GMD88289.1 probable E3 ubiquitin-protein ligase LUL4 [Ipomoea batatas]
MGISFSTNTSRRSNIRSGYYGNPYAYPAPSPYPYPAHHPHLLPPPPPPPVNSYYGSTGYNGYPVLGRALLPPSCPYHCNDWGGVRLAPPPQGVPVPPPPPPPYRQSKKVKSGVNVHKDTAKLELDERNPDQHLVSFVFDALCDGSITIFYFAKEEPSCSFVPIYPEVYAPISIPFHKGLGQRFQQPIGTGIDLGFFALEDLSGPLSGKDVFPLVITAATYLPSPSTNEYSSNTQQNLSFHMQANYAVLEKNREGYFNVKVVRQALWVDGVCYELHEIYGIGNHTPDYDNNGSSKDCVICMTEPKDTAVLPCRHMCMCNGCARTLRLQSNKCPICRQHVEELLEIQINNLDD